MIKKILLYLGIAAGIALALYLIWTFLVPKPEIPPPSGGGITGVLPQGGTAGIATTSVSSSASSSSEFPVVSKISDHPVFRYWIDAKTNEIKYLASDGEVWDAKQGPSANESSQTLSGLRSAEPSPDGTKVLVSFGGNNREWAIYNSEDGSWSPLPPNIVNATWGAGTSQLIGIVRSATAAPSLSFIDLTKNPPAFKSIIPSLTMNDVVMRFHAPQTLLITEEPSAYYASSVWEINLKTAAINQVLSPELGRYALASKGGSMIFDWTKNGILIANTDTLSNFTLPFPAFPDKCDSTINASSTDIFCFSPENIGASLLLPDDYLERAFYSVDTLYDYNPSTRNTNSVLLSGTPGVPLIDATEITSSNGDIYFINRYDNALYQVTLPGGSQ